MADKRWLKSKRKKIFARSFLCKWYN